MSKSKITELAGDYVEPAKKKKEDPLSVIETDVADSLLSLQNYTFSAEKRAREFRTSSLPFCPLLDFIKDPNIESYKKSHYTSTGTAIHETIQSWSAIHPTVRKKMWGNWKCTGCRRVVEHQFVPSKICECEYTVSTTDFHRGWPKHWTYEEVDYNYHGLTGHIDMIRFPTPTFAYVKDYKTTELEIKRNRYNWKQDKVSNPAYVVQIRTYCTVLDLKYGLPIKGWTLSNVERGRPITSLKDFHPQLAVWSRKHSLRWDKYLKSSIENNKLLGKLEDQIEKENPKKAKRVLKEVIENRPCKSQSDYDTYMKYKFYGDTSCNHCDVCFKSDSAVMERMLLELAKKE